VSERQDVVVEEMEQSLTSWIEDWRQKNIPVSLSVIRVRLSVCVKIGRNA
jgi:hypothetical protein